MTNRAYIAGIGITPFGKHLDRTLTDLAHEAVTIALTDAGIGAADIGAAWVGTAGAPVVTGQVCIPGQVLLRGIGISRVPIVNVENACATSSTAFQQAVQLVQYGAYDIVLAVGAEKLYHPDKARAFSVFTGCVDRDSPAALEEYLAAQGMVADGTGGTHSLFMDIYATMARQFMSETGATAKDFAEVSAKNSVHGSLNPNAQFRSVVSAEEVLGATPIVDPLTLLMCSPIGDGASAAVIMSENAVRRLGVRAPVRVDSVVLASGYSPAPGEPDVATWIARTAYNEAGIDPSDIDCVELHDATAPAELLLYSKLGLCAPGEEMRLLHDGHTRLGGRVPVNPSGGLVRKGHPIGATGIGQLHELALQLRGEARDRQVDGARVAVAENGGGFLVDDVAATTLTVLSR
ncbi:MAG: acetyl-CoA acetyltransferase [Rhodococcus sp. (in: high G+C Gram-positive bacteria)]|jgi:acetyl-CoA acetyltransferase